MTAKIKIRRNSQLGIRPDPESLAQGQPALNSHPGQPGLFFPDSSGGLVKVGPTAISSEPPSGQPCLGESWLQPISVDIDTPILWVYDGVNWVGVELGEVYEPPAPPPA